MIHTIQLLLPRFVNARALWFAAIVFLGTPSSAWARTSAPSARSNLFGWLLILGSVALTTVFVLWFNKRAGPRSVRAGALSRLLPPDSGLSIDSLHVSVQKRWETTGHSVAVVQNTGYVRTHGRPYKVLDFGYSVTNRSDQYLRFQLKLSRVDMDGYVVNRDRYSWTDLAPNESRRMWFGFETRSPGELIGHRVSELSIGRTPPGGPNEGAHFHFTTTPQLGLYSLLDCNRADIWQFLPLGPLQIAFAFASAFIVCGVGLWTVAQFLDFMF